MTQPVNRPSASAVVAVPKGFRILIVGNIDARRTEAEIYDDSASPSGDPVAAVYESPSGWVTSLMTQESTSADQIPDAIVGAARRLLAEYVNRRGENPPAGLTRPGMALWLMEKTDGTAVGQRIR